MKNAIYYVLLFIAVQFFTYYPTVILWLWAEGMPIGRAAMSTLQGNTVVSTSMVIVSQIVFSILLLILFLWRKYSVVSPAWMRTRQWTVLLWSGIVGIGTIIPSQGMLELLPELPDMLQQTMTGVLRSPYGYIAVCILAPFVEELVFRGAVLRSLLGSMKPVWAVTLSALFFALVHGNPAQMPHAFIIGLLLGWMYWRTGSILPGIALHWVNNSVAYVVVRLMPQYTDAHLIDIFGSSQRVAMAIAFSLMILLPALYQLHSNMKRA